MAKNLGAVHLIQDLTPGLAHENVQQAITVQVSEGNVHPKPHAQPYSEARHIVLELHPSRLREVVAKDVDRSQNRDCSPTVVGKLVAGGNDNVLIAIIIQVHEAGNAGKLGKLCARGFCKCKVTGSIPDEDGARVVRQVWKEIIEGADVGIELPIVVDVRQRNRARKQGTTCSRNGSRQFREGAFAVIQPNLAAALALAVQSSDQVGVSVVVEVGGRNAAAAMPKESCA
mmetsp:Transcript_23788/g.56362  ORF Transcript_23788/g.56362 Transcript_23788/m.56362 type:complete len:229 (+) Transcript_23788:806-1492(+)